MTNLGSVILRDITANRPAASIAGRLFFDTTLGKMQRDNGSTWDDVAETTAGSGSITASGYTQNTARLLGRTTASAGAIEEITVGTGLSLSAGSLTATGGGSGTASALTLTPTSDTQLDSQNATTNYDTATTLGVGNKWGTASFTRFALFTFDTTSLATKTIASARLLLYRTDATDAHGTDRHLEARRILRAYVSAQATWNVYSTGNNWTTAGGQSVGNDIATEIAQGPFFGDSSAQERWHAIDVTRLVQDDVDASSTTLRLMVGANVDGQGSNVTSWASIDNATTSHRPKLAVVYY